MSNTKASKPAHRFEFGMVGRGRGGRENPEGEGKVDGRFGALSGSFVFDSS